MLKRRSAKVMPAELDRIAINHQLGTRYLWSRSVLPAGAVRFILWIAFIGVALLAFATNMAVIDQREHGAWYNSSILLVVSSLPLILAIHLWRKVKRTPVEWIGLYERGMVFIRAQEDPIALAWTDVETLFRHDIRVHVNGKYARTEHNAGINGKGSMIALGDNFPDAEDLLEKITDRVGDAMRPRMVTNLKAGNPVNFSPFRLHRDWIELVEGGRRLNWDEVGQIEIRDGTLRITKRGDDQLWIEPWAEVATVNIPNLKVFLTLVDALRVKGLEFVT